MKNKVNSLLKNKLTLHEIDDFFKVESVQDSTFDLNFVITPQKIIFPVREGELIEDMDLFEIGDTYFLTYPGTASMKTVVIYQDDFNILIGGKPSYEFTKISLTRIDSTRFELSFQSKEHLFYLIPFAEDWTVAADKYMNVIGSKKSAGNARKPRYMLQLGVKDPYGVVNIKHFSELLPVVEKFHELYGNANIVHFYGTGKAGFDRMFPDYTIDPGLGGEDALRDLLNAIKSFNMLSSHHYNPRIADVNWIKANKSFENAIVSNGNGFTIEPYAGAPHYVMNLNYDNWFERCFETVNYLSGLGFDYLEIDQFTYQRNFDVPGLALTLGYKKMVDRFIKMGLTFWLEGVSDIFQLSHGNFYQILIRNRSQRWETGENRRGYPFGRSYAEFFMYLWPDAEVSHQVFTENKKFDRVLDRYQTANRINASIYDMELGFYDENYLSNLTKIAELIGTYEK